METKYVIIIPDGAADEPQDAFDGKTPIEAAKTPNIDNLAEHGFRFELSVTDSPVAAR